MRSRVTAAFVACAVVINALFVTAAVLWGHDMEVRFIEATMGEQLQLLIRQNQIDPASSPPATVSMQGFVSAPGDDSTLPAYLRGLTPGTYERVHAAREYHIMVEDHRGRRYYLTFDATHLEPLEGLFHNLLIGGSIVFTILALGLGYWLSGRILTPVRTLADQVNRSEPGAPSELNLRDFPSDEVGELAQTFNAYLERLQAFTRREAEFTAHMSHQLRNYLFVIRSTAELLGNEVGAERQCRVLVDRLQRAIHEMASLLDVVMILAREQPSSEPSPEDSSNVEDIVREVLESRESELKRKNVRIELAIDATPKLPAPEPMVRTVVCNMIDGAIADVSDQSVFVSLDKSSVTVAESKPPATRGDQGPIVETQRFVEPSQSLERGNLFNLIQLICERYGWHFATNLLDGRGLESRFLFGD